MNCELQERDGEEACSTETIVIIAEDGGVGGSDSNGNGREDEFEGDRDNGKDKGEYKDKEDDVEGDDDVSGDIECDSGENKEDDFEGDFESDVDDEEGNSLQDTVVNLQSKILANGPFSPNIDATTTTITPTTTTSTISNTNPTTSTHTPTNTTTIVVAQSQFKEDITDNSCTVDNDTNLEIKRQSSPSTSHHYHPHPTLPTGNTATNMSDDNHELSMNNSTRDSICSILSDTSIADIVPILTVREMRVLESSQLLVKLKWTKNANKYQGFLCEKKR